jgi:3-dehydroquinate dehydratase/shikimate dehydrogenase
MVSIAVPISAADAEGVLTLGRHAQAAGADLVEVRLDTCVKLGADPAAVVAILPKLALPAILTIRHESENGDWQATDIDRVRLYNEAMRLGVAWIDIELAQFQALTSVGLVRNKATKLILSYHDFDGMGSDLPGRIAAMKNAGADWPKVAVRPADAADLAVVRDLYQTTKGPLVAIAMGEHGLPSRLLAGVWGAALTFARLDGDVGSAPGQPTVGELLKLYRVNSQNAQTKVYGVIGSPVSHSLSPLIHNTAFIHHKLNAVYVPFRVEDAVAFWRACGEWIDGLSITIPHKTTLIGQMHTIEDLARRIGAMNTVYRDRDLKPCGANTDALAVISCVEEQICSVKGRVVLVLGAGGVGRAIGVAMKDRGARVIIANRTADKAKDLADEIGAEYMTLDQALSVEFDVLVNGTSAGMGKPDESPWPTDHHRADSVVFDTVYHPLETRLLRDAQRAGARTVGGLEMLLRQALGQYQRWTGRDAPEHLMMRACLDRLGATRME